MRPLSSSLILLTVSAWSLGETADWLTRARVEGRGSR
ncbi:hypothetical protein WA016_02442 [Myxococcus stipitatus]